MPLLAAVLAGCAREPATLVFLSDFGVKDSAAAVCKGVMWRVAPRLRVVDLTHQVDAYDVAAAGRLIEQTLPFYPKGTVFVAVVDPGVGSARRSIAMRTKGGRYLVGPDNGLFTAALERDGLDAAVELTERRFHREGELSSTFHGRDVFSAVGAHLAAGARLEDMGPRVEAPARREEPPAALRGGAVSGVVRYIEDPYGNVVTNIPRALLERAGLRPGIELSVGIGARRLSLPFKNTFSDVPEGRELALYHSRDALSFSVNLGDFARRHRVRAGEPVRVVKKP